MKKKFKMDNVDCANCAQKMEDNIKKIDGVNDAKMSFMTQKLTLDYDESREAEILEAAQEAVKKVDVDTSIIL